MEGDDAIRGEVGGDCCPVKMVSECKNRGRAHAEKVHHDWASVLVVSSRFRVQSARSFLWRFILK